tara:strand:+ start:324 stop:773 length:450 start_codon:yes stop_codon:yes gene_type:complete
MLLIEILKLNDKVDNKDWFSKNDLYIKIIYGTQIRRTNIVWDKSNPVWNEGFVFNHNATEHIIFELYDGDKWSPDELILKEKYELKNSHMDVKEVDVGILKIKIGDVYFKSREKYNTMLKKKTIADIKLKRIQEILQLNDELEAFHTKE